MKVSYACRYQDFVQMPAIRLKGLWLEAAGFNVGAEMEVRVMDGCIVLMARQVQIREIASGKWSLVEITEAIKMASVITEKHTSNHVQ